MQRLVEPSGGNVVHHLHAESKEGEEDHEIESIAKHEPVLGDIRVDLQDDEPGEKEIDERRGEEKRGDEDVLPRSPSKRGAKDPQNDDLAPNDVRDIGRIGEIVGPAGSAQNVFPTENELVTREADGLAIKQHLTHLRQKSHADRQ